MRLVPLKEDGTPDIEALNKDFSREYLADKRNPRWVAKPTVAYLWARTVKCKNCRADDAASQNTVALQRRIKKRVILTMEPNAERTRMVFSIDADVPIKGGNAAQRREHDKRIGAGTMSRSGARCPCCGTIMTMEDIRLEGQSGRLSAVMTAVAVEGRSGKEYRIPYENEIKMAEEAEKAIPALFAQIPFGIPEEQTPKGGRGASRAFSVDGYGFDSWYKVFTSRQLLALGTLVKWTRTARHELDLLALPPDWANAIHAYLACAISRTSDYMGGFCIWEHGAEEVKHVFMRWALPVTWDFAEGNILAPVERFFLGGLASIFKSISRLHQCSWEGTEAPIVTRRSAIEEAMTHVDVVVTDPPYYDAIPYSDLMDFFYIWLRRTLNGLSPELDSEFALPIAPKWNQEIQDGELIDDSSRHGGSKAKSKEAYENGMFRSFLSCHAAIREDGRLVIVFAHKQPEAWETLVSAMIRAGFVVDGTWPIQTEMRGGIRNLGRASLSSSVWLVCKKRLDGAPVGWDNQVLDEMRRNIKNRLREFWDAGIRGPDFVWAATGPALEAYSKHPVVKKANEPGPMTVGEFLTHVRRMVVDFVVGRVLSGEGDAATGPMT